jgi:hypothetical protein
MEDPYMHLDPADFFNLLESNQLSVVEDIKSLIHDHLNSTKEAWLVQGLFDYSMSKDSLRARSFLVSGRHILSTCLTSCQNLFVPVIVDSLHLFSWDSWSGNNPNGFTKSVHTML